MQSIEAAEDTSFMFIAAGLNETEIAFNTLFHETATERSSLWIVPDVSHTAAYSHDPEYYERQLTDFFTSALTIQ